MKRILFSMVCIFLITAIYVQAGTADKNEKLIQAAEKGNLQEVQAALTDGADINSIKTITTIKKHMGSKLRNVTALIVASEKGYTEIVKLLLNKGADVNVKNDKGNSALKIAKENGQIEIMEALNTAEAKK